MKPIHDNLKSVLIEDEETGDLMPFLDYAGQRFSKLVNAVVDTNKGGTIILKVTVRPSTAGALAVKPEVRVTMPKGMPAFRSLSRLLKDRTKPTESTRA